MLSSCRICFLPCISLSKVAVNTCLKYVLSASSPMLDRHVTDTLVWMRTFCMAPLGQKNPMVGPCSSSILIRMLSLQGCPGRTCFRGPVGETNFTVVSLAGRRVQVTLLRGVGRQDGSRGTNSFTGVFGQSFR